MLNLRLLLCASLLISATAAGAGGSTQRPVPLPACEPAPADEFKASTESIIDRGPTVNVTVILSLVPSADVPLARVRGTQVVATDPERVLGIPDRLVSLRRNETRKFRYGLALEKGKLHHLFFVVRSEDGSGSPYEVHTYLRVNLNPDLEPEDLDNLLQFQARPVVEGRP